MLHTALHFFLLAGIEGAGVGVAEIAANPASHRYAGRLVITTIRAGESAGGAVKLARVTTVVALVDRSVGAVVGDALVAVVPDILEPLEVVLHVGILAVADESATRDGWVGHLEVQFRIWIHLLLHVEVETVGIISLIGDIFDLPEFLEVESAEAIAQVLARCAVEAETVAGFGFPSVDCLAEDFDNMQRFLLKLEVVVNVALGVERVDRFVQTDVAEADGGTAVFEDLGNGIVRIEANAAGALHIEDGCNAGFDVFESCNAGVECATSELQAFTQDFEEALFTAIGLDRYAWQVETHHSEVVAALVLLLAVALIGAEEAATAHREFERAGDLDGLLVVEDVGIHPLARALEGELLDVVVWIFGLAVEAFADRKNQLREDGRLATFAEAADAVVEDGSLNQFGLPALAESKAEGHEGGLPVGGVERVDLIFEGLEGVVTLLLSERHGVGLGIINAPVLTGRKVLVVAGGDVGGQDFVDAVDRGAAVNVAGNLSDDLRGDSGGSGNGFGRLYLGVAHLEALSEHALEIDEHAVEHREEGRVVQVVVMQVAGFVGVHDVLGQHVLLGVVLGDDTSEQIALSWDHAGVFVGIFMEQLGVALADEAFDFTTELAHALAGDITVVAIFDVGPRKFFVGSLHELVLHERLNFGHADVRRADEFGCDCGGDLARIGEVVNVGGAPCFVDCLRDSFGREGCRTAIPFFNNRIGERLRCFEESRLYGTRCWKHVAYDHYI